VSRLGSIVVLVALAVLLAAASAASATVYEPNNVVHAPDGMSVPVNGNNGETELNTFFAAQGEAIDWKADAQDGPGTFFPATGGVITYELHQADNEDGLAWYNASGTPPTPSDLHEIISPSSPVGTQVQASVITSDPAYAGGLIGLVLLAGTQDHYSQNQFNTVCTDSAVCDPSAPWILALQYTSKKYPHSAYVAFEDGPVAANGFGNDGDFNDDVYMLNGMLPVPPTAAFSPQQASSSLAVSFTDASTTESPATITGWSWNFGDGTSSSLQSPPHTYSAPGVYTVTLTATDSNGKTDEVQKSVNVNALPIAAFSAEQASSSLAVSFTDTSTAESPATIAGWSWNFGDGTSSSLQNPSHTYTAPGVYTVTLTATDSNGETDQVSHSVTVGARVTGPPVTVAAPAILGAPVAGRTLTCQTGAWTNNPTGFSYQWFRDGTPVDGAAASAYSVAAIDEGNTLTCAVTASNTVGQSRPATSAGVRVPVPFVKRCPAATGAASGNTLGPITLGETRRAVEHAFTRSSTRGTSYEQFFCLTPRGVRVGYNSPKLDRRYPQLGTGQRVIWISTASAFYAIRGIRPGATVRAAAHQLDVGKVFVVGLNDWYLAPDGPATAIFKARQGIIQEIGIAAKELTRGRKAQRAFLTSFS
jgi:PKD repeat protein